jgi:hypothetical protein
MTLVFNSSPLIVLAKAGLLDRILQLADQVFNPNAVADEISRAKDSENPARCWIIHFPASS